MNASDLGTERLLQSQQAGSDFDFKKDFFTISKLNTSHPRLLCRTTRPGKADRILESRRPNLQFKLDLQMALAANLQRLSETDKSDLDCRCIVTRNLLRMD